MPSSYLEIVRTWPSTWTLVPGEGYAVCPNCADRVAVGTLSERMACGQCGRVFAFELKDEVVPAH